MNAWQVERAHNNMAKLCGALKCSSELLNHLLTAKILTEEEVSDVEYQKEDYLMVQMLFKFLYIRRGSYDVLLAGLEKDGQSDALGILRPPVTEDPQVEGEPKDPKDIIIGELDGNQLKRIEHVLLSQHSGDLYDCLVAFAISLRVPQEAFTKVQLSVGEMEFGDAVHHFVTGWAAGRGADATLAALISGLRDSEKNELADNLLQQFGIPATE